LLEDLVGTRSLSSGAHSRDPVALLTLRYYVLRLARGTSARDMARRALLQKYIYWLRTVFDLSGSKRSTLFADDSRTISLAMGSAMRVGPTPAEKNMVGNLHRQRVLNFLEAFYSGDVEGALARCSDDVDFIANAPVDILPHLGHRHGKAEVGEMWRTIHARYSSMRYEVPIIVGEGDKVAAIIRVFFRKRSNDRIVQFDIAVFYTLRDGRIAQIREVMDTFDLVQQLLERDVGAVLADTRPGKI
jgi:uncharacterized protein